MADQLKLSGVIYAIEDSVQVTEKLTKRNFIITTGDKYPETVAFELINDKCGLADGFTVGQEVDVLFNVRGREYNGKFYTNLSAWKIESAGNAQDAPAAQPATQNKNASLRAKPEPISDPSESLPF